MKQYETKLDVPTRKPLVTKPWREMEEAELAAIFAVTDAEVKRLTGIFDSLQSATRFRRCALTELRDRFGVDPRTGKRIARRGRGELKLIA